MRLDDETRTRLFADITLDVDPTGSTIEVSVDGTWHSCDWQGTPVETQVYNEKTKTQEPRWRQTARTTGYFAGPGATADGATVLAGPRHLTQTRVSWPGGDTLVEPSTPIDIHTN